MTIQRFIELISKYGLEAAQKAIAVGESSNDPVGSYRFYKTNNKIHIYLVPLSDWDNRESIQNFVNLLDIEWDNVYNIVGESIGDASFVENLIKECLLLEQKRPKLEEFLKQF